MGYLSLARDYVAWHYTTALRDMGRIWLNYLWFVNHLFSVREVLGTLFSPWKRLQEKTVSPLKDFEGFLGNVFINIMMRLVGLVVRLGLIIVALIGFALITIVGVLLFPLWIFMPFLLVHAFVAAIGLFFS
jgi:hypothetical protein